MTTPDQTLHPAYQIRAMTPLAVLFLLQDRLVMSCLMIWD